MASAIRTLSRAFLVPLLAMAGVAEAGYGFLTRANRDAAAQQLFSELTALLGHGASHGRLARIEDAMRPMFAALPKKDDGGIDEGVARYALNRYFLTRRGWHIGGIAPDGERWNASTSTATLKSKMPAFIIELLEEHVARKGLGLGELAVLAATVEDLVHSDALEVLTLAYEAHNFSTYEPLGDEAKEELIIRTFVLFYTMPWTQASHNNSRTLQSYLMKVPKTNPGWKDTMLWVEDLKGAIRYRDLAEHNSFSKKKAYFGDYPSMVYLVEQIIDGFGVFQDIQCRELKNQLMELETRERNDGRVLLTSFYGPYIQNISEFFVESPEYLRSLGALDERDPKRPSVIVPNYIYGPNFCLATENSFSNFCCVDQCNVLMEGLERTIARPAASAGMIAELVTALRSDTVAAPRNLSSSLRQKLDAIAEQHGGYVPLHGRLFAQWMHHAFPHECPQPREAGVVEALLAHDQWRASRNASTVVSKEELQQLWEWAAEPGGAEDQDEASLWWTDEEELITSLDVESLGRSRASPEGTMRVVLRCLAMCGAAMSLASILLQSLRASSAARWLQASKGASSCDVGLAGRVHAI